MRFLSSMSGLALILVGVCAGQSSSTSLNLGFVHIQTVREAERSRSGADMAPDLVIRLSGEGREIFAFSGTYGSVVVPLRPGKYCAQLFAKNGRSLKLSPNEKSCFRVGISEQLEIGVVAAYDPEVKILPPPSKRQ
jgi:hypothetical protein